MDKNVPAKMKLTIHKETLHINILKFIGIIRLSGEEIGHLSPQTIQKVTLIIFLHYRIHSFSHATAISYCSVCSTELIA